MGKIIPSLLKGELSKGQKKSINLLPYILGMIKQGLKSSHLVTIQYNKLVFRIPLLPPLLNFLGILSVPGSPADSCKSWYI